MSTRGVLTAGIVWFTLTVTSTAQTIDFTTPIARKAVKAIGPAEKQREFHGFSCNTEAVFTVDDNGKVKVTGTLTADEYGKFHADVMPVINGNPISLVFVLSGKKAWVHDSTRNRVNKLDDDVYNLVRNDLLAVRLAQRPTLLLDKRTELSTLGFFKIKDERAEGLKVKVKGMPEVDMLFSMKTGLPMKASVRILEPGGAEVEHSFLFEDWKDVNGLKQFHKLTMFRDEKKTFEMTLSNLNLQKNAEKTLFAEPE